MSEQRKLIITDGESLARQGAEGLIVMFDPERNKQLELEYKFEGAFQPHQIQAIPDQIELDHEFEVELDEGEIVSVVFTEDDLAEMMED